MSYYFPQALQITISKNVQESNSNEIIFGKIFLSEVAGLHTWLSKNL